MGITRSRLEKRKVSGGKTNICRKRRKHESARLPAATKLGKRRCSVVRTRGGNFKIRGLQLSEGNFSWGTEAIARPSRILDVMYNATSNELVRTKTLVKNCIVAVDATPFKAWYAHHYGVDYDVKHKKGSGKDSKEDKKARKSESVSAKKGGGDGAKGKSVGGRSRGASGSANIKKKGAAAAANFDPRKAQGELVRKWFFRGKNHKIEKAIEDQLKRGRLLCRITSRPGQTGRADGAILEGAELMFYQKKIEKKN